MILIILIDLLNQISMLILMILSPTFINNLLSYHKIYNLYLNYLLFHY